MEQIKTKEELIILISKLKYQHYKFKRKRELMDRRFKETAKDFSLRGQHIWDNWGSYSTKLSEYFNRKFNLDKQLVSYFTSQKINKLRNRFHYYKDKFRSPYNFKQY